MNLAHLHLLLNHVPTVGFSVGLCLFLVSLYRKDDHFLQRLSLAVLFLVALLSLPVYMTGVAASEMIAGSPGVSTSLIQTHENAALLAFIVMEITGAVAWLALWQFRRFSRPARGTLTVVLLLAIVSFGLMARTAYIGGGIRHPEILTAEEATTEDAPSTSTGWLTTTTVKSLINGTDWAWPASEAIHFIGLGLSFGVVLLLNLRLLGMMKSLAFADLHRMLPWGILGFASNFVTGMLFFIGIPEQYTTNPAFQWKILFMVVVGVNLLYFTSFDQPWKVRAGDDAPATARVIAASTIFLWVGVLFFGRMLPFLGGAF